MIPISEELGTMSTLSAGAAAGLLVAMMVMASYAGLSAPRLTSGNIASPTQYMMLQADASAR